jgi:hypothetical protein
MPEPITNPYHPGPPVENVSGFFGRTDLLSNIRRDLEQTNVILLQGQRRIGKTSFLKKIQQSLTDIEGETGPFLPISFDIQPYIGDTLPMFQQHLAQAIASATSTPVFELIKFKADPKAFQEKWLPLALQDCAGRDLVLLVDEFDNLGEISLSKSLDSILGFIASLVAGEAHTKWILTVGCQIGSLPIQYDAIINQAIKETLGRLTRAEAEQLILDPARGILSYTPAAINRIYQLTSGQPHFTQGLCSEVFNRVVLDEERDTADDGDVDQILPGFADRYESAITSIVRGVPPLNERVLAAVARLNENGHLATRREIVKLLMEYEISLSANELSEILDQLAGWDLLTAEGSGWHFSVELVRLYVAEKMSLDMTNALAVDVMDALAKSRFEDAETARKAGQYPFAIAEYQEALKVKPAHRGSLRGLAEAYRKTGDVDGTAEVLNKLYQQGDKTVLEELIEAKSNLASRAEKAENYATAINQYEELLKLDSENAGWGEHLARTLVWDNKKRLEKISPPEKYDLTNKVLGPKYLEDNRQGFAAARQALEKGLSQVTEKKTVYKLNAAMKQVRAREQIDETLEKAGQAYARKDWDLVAKHLLSLYRSDVKLGPDEEKALASAARDALNNKTSFFYSLGLARMPAGAKSILGIFIGLVAALLLVELVPAISSLGAYVYIGCTGLSLWILRAAARRRQRPILLGHLAAILVSAGSAYLCRSWINFPPPATFPAYVTLLLVTAVPMLGASSLDMPSGCSAGWVYSVLALFSGAVGGTVGWVVGKFLGNIFVHYQASWLATALAPGIGLMTGWLFVLFYPVVNEVLDLDSIDIDNAIKILGGKS